MTKKCYACKRKLPISKFSKNKTKKDGFNNWCRECINSYHKEYIRTPKGKMNRRKRVNKYRKTRKGKTMTRKTNLRLKYGITLEQYDQMFAAQEGRCAICGNPESHVCNGVPVRLAVDHDHTNNRVRQLLCHNCNAVLGYVEDEPELLQEMIDYLEKHKS